MFHFFLLFYFYTILSLYIFFIWILYFKLNVHFAAIEIVWSKRTNIKLTGKKNNKIKAHTHPSIHPLNYIFISWLFSFYFLPKKKKRCTLTPTRCDVTNNQNERKKNPCKLPNLLSLRTHNSPYDYMLNLHNCPEKKIIYTKNIHRTQQATNDVYSYISVASMLFCKFCVVNNKCAKIK